MNLDEQLQDLIQHAPQDGVTPDAVGAIAPALRFIAEQLRHADYYILQTLEEGWMMTTLSNRDQPDTQKNVIYAYSALKDATSDPSAKDPQVVALPTPVTHILFQMVAMSHIDSLIFFEEPGNFNIATEVSRENLYAILQLHLQQATPVPPDIA